jgi:hypothetical protein
MPWVDAYRSATIMMMSMRINVRHIVHMLLGDQFVG